MRTKISTTSCIKIAVEELEELPFLLPQLFCKDFICLEQFQVQT